MAGDLKAIVQHMIDAGESEENIATVIKGYKQPAAPKPESAAAHFQSGPQAVVDVPDGGSTGSTLPNMLQRMAHPQTDSDVMALMTAPTDLTRGAIENLPSIIRAAKDLPGDIAASAKDAASSAIDAVTAMRQPVGRGLEVAGDYIGKYPLLNRPLKVLGDITSAVGQQMAKPTVAEATDMLNKLHQASNAPVNPWELKFLQSVDQQVRGGRALSGAQGEVLQRIYKTVFP